MKNLFPLALPLILGADLIHPIVGQAQLESSAVIAQAQDNSFWQFNAQTNQLQLMLPAGVAPRHFLLARPMRLVIDFPHSGTIAPQDFTYAGAVERLTLSSQVEGQVRLILYLRAGVELQPKQVALQQIDSQRWLITPLIVEPDSPSILNETPTINTPVSPNNAPNSPTERPPIASPLDSLENRAAALTVPSATPTVDETPAIPDTFPIPNTPSNTPIPEQTLSLPILKPQIPAENLSGEDSAPDSNDSSTIVNAPPLPVLDPRIPIFPQPDARRPDRPLAIESPSFSAPSIAPQTQPKAETDAETEIETEIEPQALSTQPLVVQPLRTSTTTSTTSTSATSSTPIPTQEKLPVTAPSPETTPPVNDRNSRRRARRPRTATAPSSLDQSSSQSSNQSPNQSSDQPPSNRPPVSLSTVPLTAIAEESDQSRRSPDSAFPSVAPPVDRPVSSTLITPKTIVAPPIVSPLANGLETDLDEPAETVEFGSPLPGVNSSKGSPAPSPTAIPSPTLSRSEEEDNTPPLPLPAVGLPTGVKPPAPPINPSPIPANPLPTVPERSPVPTSLPPLPIQSPAVSLEKGTPITLRYTGTVPLDLSERDGVQEVLVVDEDVKALDGSVLIPAGSEVLGHFETNWRGSRFVAQAITLLTENPQRINSPIPQNRNQVIDAKSDRIDGDRAFRPLNLAVGSGVGAVAGTFIAGGFGALGGIALGAATGYFVSPQPATIVPHQTFVIYLNKDW